MEFSFKFFSIYDFIDKAKTEIIENEPKKI